MTKEEKQLLLKDLCGRLLYGVKVQVPEHISINDLKVYGIETPYRDSFIEKRNEHYLRFWNDSVANIDVCKPYLRPMSSMTEEEKSVLSLCDAFIEPRSIELKVDFYNRQHLDYRGLIEKGLAIEAPEGMYKMEE